MKVLQWDRRRIGLAGSSVSARIWDNKLISFIAAPATSIAVVMLYAWLYLRIGFYDFLDACTLRDIGVLSMAGLVLGCAAAVVVLSIHRWKVPAVTPRSDALKVLRAAAKYDNTSLERATYTTPEGKAGLLVHKDWGDPVLTPPIAYKVDLQSAIDTGSIIEVVKEIVKEKRRAGASFDGVGFLNSPDDMILKPIAIAGPASPGDARPLLEYSDSGSQETGGRHMKCGGPIGGVPGAARSNARLRRTGVPTGDPGYYQVEPGNNTVARRTVSMPAQVLVSRVRVSHIAGQIHNRLLPEIGAPNQFEDRLCNPNQVVGLPVSLPFEPALQVDRAFWETNAERTLSVPVENTPPLRRAAVPLRYSGKLDTAADTPRLEAHLHPFGIVVSTTVDLLWPEGADLKQAWARVDALENQPATVRVGDDARTTTLGKAAKEATSALISRLTNHGIGNSWDMPRHRLTTVISGKFQKQLGSMPAANSALHKALHYLSGGPQGVASPANSFVSQWLHSEYGWPPDSLVYMLDCGTATLSAAAADTKSSDEAQPEYWESTSDRHRRLLLTLAYVTALASLVKVGASGAANSEYFPAWAKGAADRLGRLYGPAEVYKDWGLVPRAFLLRTGAIDDVNALRVDALKPGQFPEVPFPQ